MEMKELFISYGRDPIVSRFVEKLRSDLEAEGFSVWLDTHDIPSGSDWHGAIGSGLSNCKAIVPVITQKFIGSRYCVNELYTADGDKKLIFPVMLEEVDFDASESGQGVKFTTSGVNWCMCRLGKDDYSVSITKLVSAMKDKGLGKGSSSESTTPLPAFQPLIGPVNSMPFKLIPDVENPEGITTTSDGGLVVSIVRQKVLIFNSDHEKILELGGEPGLGMGQFLCPTGVAIDDKGHILIASHYYVKRFSKDGRCLQQAGGTGGDGSFSIESPRGLVIGNNGRVYISEQQKHRITILNSDLSFYKSFSDGDRMLGSGHLNTPQGLAINKDGQVYVADMMNHVVQVFDAEGNFLFRFGKMGHGPGTTTSPMALAVDSDDYIYVGGATAISIFTCKGEFMRTFGEYGNEIGKFSTIRAMHIDKDGVLYVGEWSNNRIQMFRTREEENVHDVKHHNEVNTVAGNLKSVSFKDDSSKDVSQHHLPTAALNISGKGGGMTVIGGSVQVGPGVIFGGNVSIQPGAHVIAHHGHTKVPIPVAVPHIPLTIHGQGEYDGVVFAKPANTSCVQAGVRKPVSEMEVSDTIMSMCVNDAGTVVVSGDNVTVYSCKHEKINQLSDGDFSGACIVFENQDVIVAVSIYCIGRFDSKLNILSKVKIHERPELSTLTHPYAVAVGSEGRIYVAGAGKCHIINSDFTKCHTFGEGCGQAFAIAVNTKGNVYVPMQDENTICVFSPTGDFLFKFGGPDCAPLPHMSLLVPMSIAIDSNDNVYTGIGLQNINKFDAKGKFIEDFAASVNFEALPKPMCTDQSRHLLYVAVEVDAGSKILSYELDN